MARFPDRAVRATAVDSRPAGGMAARTATRTAGDADRAGRRRDRVQYRDSALLSDALRARQGAAADLDVARPAVRYPQLRGAGSLRVGQVRRRAGCDRAAQSG